VLLARLCLQPGTLHMLGANMGVGMWTRRGGGGGRCDAGDQCEGPAGGDLRVSNPGGAMGHSSQVVGP
jgi:hypothetical protein